MTESSTHESFYNQSDWTDGFYESPKVNGSTVELEIGYGLTALDSLAIITPYGALDLQNGVGTKHRIGTQFGMGSDFELELEGAREDRSNGEYVDSVKLRGNYEW